jgi:hypothetical protein
MIYSKTSLLHTQTRDPKINLYILINEVPILNIEANQYRKGPKFSVLINEVYLLLKRGLLKRFYCMCKSYYNSHHEFMRTCILGNLSSQTRCQYNGMQSVGFLWIFEHCLLVLNLLQIVNQYQGA